MNLQALVGLDDFKHMLLLGIEMVLGLSLTLLDAAANPMVELPDTDASHVLVMVDIDAPGGPESNNLSPLLHWLIATPSGLEELSEDQDGINATVPYSGPAPPEGSGPHRYVILELENPSSQFEIPSGFPESFDSRLSRVRFDVEEFIEAGDFSLLSATWFTVTADDSPSDSDDSEDAPSDSDDSEDTPSDSEDTPSDTEDTPNDESDETAEPESAAALIAPFSMLTIMSTIFMVALV